MISAAGFEAYFNILPLCIGHNPKSCILKNKNAGVEEETVSYRA